MTRWESFKGGCSRFVWWVWSPIRLLWAEFKGLRTEELRSVASVQAMVIAFAGFVVIMRDDLNWFHPGVGITIIAMFLLGAIAGYAMKGKADIARKQIELGVSKRKPPQIDDPDEGESP